MRGIHALGVPIAIVLLIVILFAMAVVIYKLWQTRPRKDGWNVSRQERGQRGNMAGTTTLYREPPRKPEPEPEEDRAKTPWRSKYTDKYQQWKQSSNTTGTTTLYREPPKEQEQGKPQTPWRPKYMDKFQLLNKSEQTLFQRIIEAEPNMHIFCQVSMSQLFHMGHRKGKFTQLGEVGRKSVDFLLCRKEDTSIVLAIELNGPAHEREDQKKSDETKCKTLEEAGIPLVIFYPDRLPDVQTIRETLAPRIAERQQYEKERDKRLGRS